MAMNVGSIFAELGFKYDDKQFRRFSADVKKAGGETDRYSQQSDRAAKAQKAMRVGAMGAAAGFTAIAAAAMKGAKQQQELAASTAAVARTTGMSNEEAGKWVQLAKVRGIETKQLNMGLTSFSKQIVAAKNGTEASVGAFKQLGISQKELQNMSTSEAIAAVAEGLKRMPDGADKAAIASKFFGRSYQGLLPILNKGREGLQKNIAEIDKYGMKTDDTFVKNGLKTKEAMRQLNLAMGTVYMTLAKDLVPVLPPLVRGLADVIRFVTKGIAVFNSLPGPVKVVVGVIAGLAAGAMALGPSIAIFGGLAKGITLIGTAVRVLFAILMSNPWVRVATIIVTAGLLIYDNWDKISKFLNKSWRGLRRTFGGLADWVRDKARKGFLGPVPLIISRWGDIKEFFKRLSGSIVGFFSGIGGKMTRPFTSAFKTMRKAVGDAMKWIKTAFADGIAWLKAAYNGLPGWVKKLINAGAKSASWVIGKLTGKAKGGKVGPTAGGPQMYVAGEGGKDEWVISQEGDRKKNIGYAIEALTALGGAKGFRLGGKVRKAKGSADRYARQRETMERNYSIAQREAELTGEGIDPTEYALLEKLRKNINGKRASEEKAIGKALDFAKTDATTLKKAIARSRGAKRNRLKEQLQELNEFRQEYSERRRQLGFEIREGALDLTDLLKQRDQAAADAKKKKEEEDAANAGPGLAEQFASFNSSRFDLLRSFGGNTSSLPASVMASAAAPAGQGGKGAPTIVNNYTTAPPDPAAWNKQMELQIKAAA